MDATITKMAVTMPDGSKYYGPLPVTVKTDPTHSYLVTVTTPDGKTHRVDGDWFASVAVYRRYDNLYRPKGTE